MNYNFSPKANYNAVLDVQVEDTGAEPVSLADAKDYAKIDTGTAEDILITSLIKTAREQCESFSNISFMNHTITAVLTNLNGGIYFPYGPVKSLTSITDEDGNAIDIGNYKISGVDFQQLIYPRAERIKVVYTTGYSILPEQLVSAVKQQFFYLYEQRGEEQQELRAAVVVQILSNQARATLQRVKR